MRIRELFEGNFFKDSDFTEPKNGGRQINFDLADDVAHFMNQDNNVYRRYMHPCLTEFLSAKKSKKDPKPEMFAHAVKESYKAYIKKFPIRELPDELDEETCAEVCSKLFAEHDSHHEAGKYKD